MKIPFWLIYSYWVFFTTILWLGGFIKWSPLISAIIALLGASVTTIIKREFNQSNLFIIATHIVPVWILRNTSIDIKENLVLFLVYNLVLLASGTDYSEIYQYIFTHRPETIHGYLCQRMIIDC
jgi:hypothetical protein